MAKFFTIFACLLLTCSISHATFSSYWLSPNADTYMSMPAPSPAPTPDCESTIDNVLDCLSFLTSDDDSKPDKQCCSAIETAATTNIGCLCAIIESDQLTEFHAKAMTIPSGCGMKSPFGQCDRSPISSPSVPKPSPISPSSMPKPSPISPSSVPKPSLASPNQGPSETPAAAPFPSMASTTPAPAPNKALAAPTAYPISISVIAISSILFAYFC
ncbi:unnamed protein product [Lupinus luteus]|uniref:Bifunctional inhibitor/plant lipid transfer protein/seed storage helical domain-containing protein n=1 Tax=Lupinus luteus TaxID=3873 RepID=A0AAV1X2R8_LUPLU